MSLKDTMIQVRQNVKVVGCAILDPLLDLK